MSGLVRWVLALVLCASSGLAFGGAAFAQDVPPPDPTQPDQADPGAVDPSAAPPIGAEPTVARLLADGRIAVASDDHARAIALFTRALAAAPGNPSVEGELGYAQLLAGDLDQAEHHTREALRSSTDDSQRGRLKYNLGRVAQARGQRDVALGLYRESVALRPNDEVSARISSLEAARDHAEDPTSETADDESDGDPVLPEGREPTLAVTVTPEEVFLGDAVTYAIEVQVESGAAVTVPEQPSASLEVLNRNAEVTPGADGKDTHRFALTLLALELGEQELPGVRLRVLLPDGTIGFVRTEPQQIEVKSVIGNEPEPELKPPTDPVVVMQDDYTLLWILGALALIALTALLTWLLSRWWAKRKREAIPPPPPRPPWEVADEKLAKLRLQRDSALEEGQVVEWVDGVSDVLREYLGVRYGFDGLESTSDEVARKLRQIAPPGLSLVELTALLGDCDLVKFAKATFGAEQMNELLEGVARVVRQTTPSAERSPGVVRFEMEGVAKTAGGKSSALAGASAEKGSSADDDAEPEVDPDARFRGEVATMPEPANIVSSAPEASSTDEAKDTEEPQADEPASPSTTAAVASASAVATAFGDSSPTEASEGAPAGSEDIGEPAADPEAADDAAELLSMAGRITAGERDSELRGDPNRTIGYDDPAPPKSIRPPPSEAKPEPSAAPGDTIDGSGAPGELDPNDTLRPDQPPRDSSEAPMGRASSTASPSSTVEMEPKRRDSTKSFDRHEAREAAGDESWFAGPVSSPERDPKTSTYAADESIPPAHVAEQLLKDHVDDEGGEDA